MTGHPGTPDPSRPEIAVLCSDLPEIAALADLDRLPNSALLDTVRQILDEEDRKPTPNQEYQSVI
ncbi:hypothetical protein [Actinokineospora enzanensis]|uniref:hypothetical protein n=1 Tax=Actinokineospora enzanensis TaxID=155975 RepID=UPI00036EDCED|nr:hypothetical protein [Actinokineospora enzanensis]